MSTSWPRQTQNRLTVHHRYPTRKKWSKSACVSDEQGMSHQLNVICSPISNSDGSRSFVSVQMAKLDFVYFLTAWFGCCISWHVLKSVIHKALTVNGIHDLQASVCVLVSQAFKDEFQVSCEDVVRAGLEWPTIIPTVCFLREPQSDQRVECK